MFNTIVKFQFDTKNLSYKQDFFVSIIFFFVKNTFKVALQYLFNDFRLFNTVFYLKLNFKL